MDFHKYVASYMDSRRFVAVLEAAVICLVISNCVLSSVLLGHRDAVVLVPPHLNDEVRVLADRSSEGYIKAWGLFLGELVGNISPTNLKFIQKSLEPMISPRVYRQITDILNMQAEEIMADHISITFEPKTVTYEKETGLVFVTGQTHVKGPTGPARSFLRTYEFLIELEDFRPMLTWMEMYEGNPHDLSFRTKEKERKAKRKVKHEDD